MKNIFLLLAAALLVTMTACNHKKTVQNTAFSGKNYSLEFPANWERNDNPPMGLDLLGLSPLENDQDTFRENINVVLENLPKNIDETQYLALSITNLNQGLGVDLNKKFTPIKIGKNDGYYLNYQFNMGNKDFDNDVYVIIHDNSVYVITYSFLKESRERFLPQFKPIIDTFQIK